MPRRGRIAKRDVLPDPVYNSKLVTRLINNIMYDGKKGVAQKIVYGAFDIVKEKTGKDPLEAFEQSMENIMPVLEVKARRVGGATYQVPMEVRPERRQTLGLRWITNYSRNRGEKTMKERLAGEIMDALNQTGGAVNKREDTHKMADANKAVAHYRWYCATGFRRSILSFTRRGQLLLNRRRCAKNKGGHYAKRRLFGINP